VDKRPIPKNDFLAAIVILALFSAVFFRSVLFNPTGMVYSPLSDLVGQTFGWKWLIRETFWGHGALPLWNPHLMCGYPILGNLNYALLLPMHLLYLLLPTGMAASWTYLLTHFLGALACWYFLRVIGVRNWGALLGGLAFGFGVRNLGHLTNGFVGHLETLPFLPLAFAFTVRLARERVWRLAGWLALCLAVILLSAFAQIFLYLIFILPLYFAWLVWSGERPRQWRLPAVQFAVAVALACGLAAVHLIPAIQLLPELSRSSELAPELYRLGSLTPRHFFTLINPELFGRIVPEWSYVGSAYFWTLSFYTPLLLLPLAFLSLGDRAGRRHRNFFLALVPALILFAMGTHGPVYDFCHRFIPGVKLFREPGRILFFMPLAMAVLAGLGWNGLQRGSGRRATWLVTAAALLVGGLAAGYAVYHDGAGESFSQSFAVSAAFFGGGAARATEYAGNLARLLPTTAGVSLVLFAASFGLILAALRQGSRLKGETLRGAALLIIAADLLFFGRGYLQTADSRELFLEPNRLVQRLQELQRDNGPFRVADLSGALSDNQACIFGIDKIGGYDPINLRVTQSRFDTINNREAESGVAWTLRVEPGFHREALDSLGARYLVSREPLSIEGLSLVESFEPLPVTLQNYGPVKLPGVRLYKNGYARPRAWVRFEGWQPSEAGGTTDIVLPPRKTLFQPPVHSIVQEPGAVTVSADFHADGVLVVSQAWSAGWRAEDLDTGEELPVHRVDGMLTAVPVDVGEAQRKRIRLTYRPPGLTAGITVTTQSLLILTLLLILGRRRRPVAQAAERGPVEKEAEDDEDQFVDHRQRIEAQQVDDQDQVEGDGQRVEKP